MAAWGDSHSAVHTVGAITQLRLTISNGRTTDMRTTKKSQVAHRGWRTGTVQDFLGLTDEEAAYVELRHQLAKSLRELRIRLNLTQIDAAKRLKSSQSRVAKMEAADATVSLDLLLRALLTLGASPEMLARTMRRCA